ncbi:ribonuclease E/G [Caulobacter sp.]|uniref:Rne/Rng family ribonuclease n=1 Tax=Caulobacter sp. TaxID=78 RepID=UPI0031D14965
MSKKMLIDAAHAEETRVVVVDGNRVEEFDFESQTRKQLRGNIYLAKVTRVEPSLQAAFIEYGGNRHGFLAFNEIHPDYYQIPVADREALMRDDSGDDEDDTPISRRASGGDDEDDGNGRDHAIDDDEDDVEEELARRKRRLMRKYKIQEVIRRRQIMLVQVVKEERGNKGAALTTYLSLAGRYGVLMPNTARGGGISRKITAVTDRKRLKSVVQSLDVPQGMGLIVRTAGAKRTKAEVKRDYEYLLRLWENIRDNTLHSVAPALIYEEEDLVKRAIRDMYDKDLDGIWVEGDAGYKEARDFMRMLMPSQAKKVFNYRDPTPLFVKNKIEDHLAQIYSPVVPLRSGGYLVINQTEALVAIDVNSGKATRERNIEATALKTNVEAAEEAARQLRLRDLAGLIVIDFIDMDEGKNNRTVEKVLKDALKDDRARIQMGKISGFGLMEISRQRRRTGVLEGTTHVCEHCEGTGRVRSVESSALAALRAVEAEALKGSGSVILKVSRSVGLYILNEKRAYLQRLVETHGLHVTVVVDDSLHAGDQEIERTELGERIAVAPPPYVEEDDGFDADAFADEEEDDEIIDDEDEDDLEREDTDDDDASARKQARDDERGDRKGRRGRRDRGRGRGRREERDADAEIEAEDDDAEGDADDRAEFGGDDDDDRRRRRRRGRRGGRRGGREDGDRPADAFVWIRPRVPFGENVFTWHDPAVLVGGNSEPRRPALEARADAVETVERAERPERPDREEREGGRRERGRRGRDRGRRGERAEAAEVVAEAVTDNVAVLPAEPAEPYEAPILAPPVIAGPPADVWVELPEAEEAPKKPKRTRSRSKKAAEPAPEAVEAVAEAVTESVAVVPAEPETAPEPAPQPVVEAAPEPVVAPEPEPVAEVAPAAPAEPDPNEITTPPEKPRRGWWRR